MSTISELRDQKQDASAALRDLRIEFDEAKKAAADKVKAEWEPRLGLAERALSNAVDLYEKAVSESASHEWEGRTVTRQVSLRNAPGWDLRTTTERGVVEVVRIGTEFPANTPSYSRPPIGTTIVRMLKKDGTPGLKFERLYRRLGNNTQIDGWQLEEEGK